MTRYTLRESSYAPWRQARAAGREAAPGGSGRAREGRGGRQGGHPETDDVLHASQMVHDRNLAAHIFNLGRRPAQRRRRRRLGGAAAARRAVGGGPGCGVLHGVAPAGRALYLLLADGLAGQLLAGFLVRALVGDAELAATELLAQSVQVMQNLENNFGAGGGRRAAPGKRHFACLAKLAAAAAAAADVLWLR